MRRWVALLLVAGGSAGLVSSAAADRYAYDTQSFTNSPGGIDFHSVACGKDPLVGGGLGDTSVDQVVLDTTPTNRLGALGLPANSWFGGYVNTNGDVAHTMTVTAICQTRGGDSFVYRSDNFRNGPGRETVGSVSCNGDPVVGGGIHVDAANLQLPNVSAPTADGTGWRGGAHNFDLVRHKITVTAICERGGTDTFAARHATLTLTPASPGFFVDVPCRHGRLVGGGFIAKDDPAEIRMEASTPTSTNDGWQVSAANRDQLNPHDVVGVAMCET